MKRSPMTARGAEEPEPAVGAGEGAGDVADDFVVNESGLIDDDDVGGVADAGTGVVGDGKDFGAVGEFDGVLLAVSVAAADVERGGVGDEFFDDDAGVVLGIGEDDDFRFGVLEGKVEGFEGDEGGLAPLAGATEDEAVAIVIEDFDLFGFGFEIEGGFGPLADGLG